MSKTVEKLPPLRGNTKREFVACKTCARVSYYDYVPYSFSTAIMMLPCGHGLTERFRDTVETITAAEFNKRSSVQ